MKLLRVILLCVATGLLAGCGEGGPAAVGGGHSHGSAHGGTAVELGRHEFQLDFVFNDAVGRLQCYVMDGHMNDFVRIPAASLEIAAKLPSGETVITLKPAANPVTGETAGDTSLFEAEAPVLKGIVSFDAVLKQLAVRTKNYTNISFRISNAAGGATTKP